jgi:hypothetical protein
LAINIASEIGYDEMKRLTKAGGMVLVLLFVLIVGAGIASAAVAGDFSSSYDGYNDGEDTEVPGHEIQVSGTLEFSGENAVEPRITIKPAQNTVLDDQTVELQQSAGSSVNFRRNNYQNGVRYAAEEIPADTDFDISFVVYPVSGLDQSEIKSAEIQVEYERPGGGTEEETIEVTTSLNNTAPQVISDLEESQPDGENGGGTPLWMQILAGIGAIAIVLTVGMFLYDSLGSGDEI